ncbi:MAG TPA: DUF2461 domain-containing protein [Acidimicrobiales bacterium]|nr:DUF2461 domain-containing protein [Acidimicrobiales bacterium]
MAFTGWPAEAIEFFEGLEADNSKAYWQASKLVYERDVYAPMAALLGDLAAEFGEGRIFRPFRDIRFSRDKSPYKTAIAASLAAGGYVQFSAQGLGAGSGMYLMAPDQLERYRAAVAEDASGGVLEELISDLTGDGIEVGGHGALKTAPKGYPKDHQRIELLRNKGLVAWRQWLPGPRLGTAKAKTDVRNFFRACQPMNEWLAVHVGPTTQEASPWR